MTQEICEHASDDPRETLGLGGQKALDELIVFPTDTPVFMNGVWWAILGDHLVRTGGKNIDMVPITAWSPR